jgi:hypothetical protein
MIRTAVLRAASLAFITSTAAQTVDKPREERPAVGVAVPIALERMLHGERPITHARE